MGVSRVRRCAMGIAAVWVVPCLCCSARRGLGGAVSLGLGVVWVAPCLRACSPWRAWRCGGRVACVPPRRGPGPGSGARTGGSRSAREGRAKQHRRCERETQREAITRSSAWLLMPSAAFLRSRALFLRDPFSSCRAPRGRHRRLSLL